MYQFGLILFQENFNQGVKKIINTITNHVSHRFIINVIRAQAYKKKILENNKQRNRES